MFTDQLREQLRYSQRAAFASGTHKNLLIQWKKFKKFCEDFRIVPLPIDQESLCLYAQYLANVMKAPETIKNYINGIRVIHMLCDMPTSVFYSFELKLTLRGISRLKQHHPKQAKPVTLALLLKMSEHVNHKDPWDVVAWSAILIAFFCFLRKSNYTVMTSDSFCEKKQLCRRDIIVGSDCLLVHIKWSKTIQFAQKEIFIPVLALPNSPLCPLKAYQNMTAMVDCGDDDPAFSIVTNKRVVPLIYSKFQAFFKKLIVLSGWDAAAFSTHSLRRGGASLAFKARVPGEFIKVHGDWASDAYLRYLAMPLNQRLSVAVQVQQFVMAS